MKTTNHPSQRWADRMSLEEAIWSGVAKTWLAKEGTTYQGAIEVADQVTSAFIDRFVTETVGLREKA